MIFVKKVLINIENNSLKISFKNHTKMREDLINTNILSNSELLFGMDYLKTNEKIVSLFLKELCEIKKITRVIFDNNELAEMIIPFLKNNATVKEIEITSDETLSFSICESLIASKHIEFINCYNIPGFLMEMLDRDYIKVETRSEFFYISNFMQENKLIQYSKIYYKSSIRVSLPLNEEDKNDFITFAKINRYLKNIRFTGYNQNDIEFILKTLKENRLKNVTLHISGNNIKEKQIEFLKNTNKKWKKSHLKCKLDYSEDYLKDNIFKQIILNTIKICSIIIIILVGSVIAFVGTRNYFAMRKVTSIQETIQNTINNATQEGNAEIHGEEYIIKNNYIASLLSINEDVVGWLKVNNTSVDYPVVKGPDNDFYLKNNLYKEKDENGWIYMDYRNSDTKLKQNTIIYGHNMYYSGVMFGTLHKAIYKNWYTNEENLTISFNTMYETMNWKIFSIYDIDKTSDYLITDFASDTDFLDYVKKMKERSVTDFHVDITSSDKILTLSTCTGDNQRLVIHAKLITDLTAQNQEKENEEPKENETETETEEAKQEAKEENPT